MGTSDVASVMTSRAIKTVTEDGTEHRNAHNGALPRTGMMDSYVYRSGYRSRWLENKKVELD